MSLSKTYLVNEIYPCLQGEGPNIGKPSMLVRLQICNLRCTWCDTPYTHTMKSDPDVSLSGTVSIQKFRRMELSEIIESIESSSKIRHVILSGGEPTLQDLAPLLDALKNNYSIEVETNGTQIPHQLHKSFLEEHYASAQWNVSPKGRNAGQEINSEALENWAKLSLSHGKVFFKFVVRKENYHEDIEEMVELAERFQLPTQRIILMAEGTKTDSQTNNEWLENICLENGWMLSPRLHVLNHGEKRGV